MVDVIQVIPLFNRTDAGFADKLATSVESIPCGVFYGKSARPCSTRAFHYTLGAALVREFRAMLTRIRSVRFDCLFPYPTDILEAVFHTEHSDWYGVVFVPYKLQELWPEDEEELIVKGRCQISIDLLEQSTEKLKKTGFKVFYIVVYMDPGEPLPDTHDIRRRN